MTSPKELAFEPTATTASSVERNHDLLEEMARSFRRVESNEEFDSKGVRTLWHRGRKGELLSWESRDNVIVKQELSFLGLLVEYKADRPLRTGHVPVGQEGSSPGVPVSHMIKMDAEPLLSTLSHASHLLRHLPARDFYAQHLLKQVNLVLNDFGTERTVISAGHFTREIERKRERPAPIKSSKKQHRSRPGLLWLGIVSGLSLLIGTLALLVWLAQ